MYRMPETVVHILERQRRAFMCGHNVHGGQKLHLLNWENICLPKNWGGLGLNSIRNKNLVILAKWIWRAYSERNSYWNQIMLQRYGAHVHYDLSRVEKNLCSPVMKKIVELLSDPVIDKFLRRENFKWKVKSGDSVYFWEDWRIGPSTLQSSFPSLYKLVRVKHIHVDVFMKIWNENRRDPKLWLDSPEVESMADFSSLASLVDKINLSQGADILQWLLGKEQFSSKLCHDLLMSSSTPDPQNSYIWRVIWKIKAPPKILVFYGKSNGTLCLRENSSVPGLEALWTRVLGVKMRKKLYHIYFGSVL